MVVDAELVPLISWCIDNEISTLASCQGTDRARGYVLFASLADLDTFFHSLADLAASNPEGTQLLGHIKDFRNGPASSENWLYEARPGAAAMRDEPGGGMWGIVRFPAADLGALKRLLCPDQVG